MPDALSVLAADHREVLDLLNELTGGAGEPEGAERKRKALAEKLAIAESKHEAVEELHFWPVVRSRLDNGDELAEQALDQEQTGKQLIHDLDHVTAGDVEFMTLVHRLESAVRDHITFEESQVWPKLRLALSEAELEDMGTRLEASKRVAPTRPHPRTPPDPKLLGTVGPAVGIMDRARDAMVGRGSGVQGPGRWRVAAMAMAIGVPSVLGVIRALLRSGERAGGEAAQAGKSSKRAKVKPRKAARAAKAARADAAKATRADKAARAEAERAAKADRAARAEAEKAAKAGRSARADAERAAKAGRLARVEADDEDDEKARRRRGDDERAGAAKRVGVGAATTAVAVKAVGRPVRKAASTVASSGARTSGARAAAAEVLRRAGDLVGTRGDQGGGGDGARGGPRSRNGDRDGDGDRDRDQRNAVGGTLRSVGERVDVDPGEQRLPDRARTALVRSATGRVAGRLLDRLAG